MSGPGGMHPLLRRVPRLQTLAVFEAAARRGSFTAAANDLGLTQSGVSRQVSQLERSLGHPLFWRRANRVELNELGRSLLAAVQDAFETIEGGLGEIDPSRDEFLIAANPGYAQIWLVPYLNALQAAFGETRLRLQLFDRDDEIADDTFDVAIHMTRTSGVPADARWLFDEEVVPIASPGYAERHDLHAGTEPQRLGSVDLLHLDGRDRQWMGWADWFQANDVIWSSDDTMLLYNNHALVMNDAMAGRGVGLGWAGLVETALDSGLLVEAGPRLARPETAYHLIPGSAARPEHIETLENWLLAGAEWHL